MKRSKSDYLSRRPLPPTGNGLTPYLDVMTIHSRDVNGEKSSVNQVDEFHHTNLLVEPIQVPNLDHTGVKIGEKVSKYPLFYPNGGKNPTLRNTVREALVSSVSVGTLPKFMEYHKSSTWDNTSKDSVRPHGGFDGSLSTLSTVTDKESIPKHRRGVSNSRMNSKLQTRSYVGPKADKRLTKAVRLRNHIGSEQRENDKRVKELLSSIKSENSRISNFII